MSNYKVLCSIFCFLTVFFTLPAQSALVGIVLDQDNQEPIEFAHVFFLSQQNTGVITNELGAFNLPIPEQLSQDTVVISRMGYQTHYFPLSSLGADQKQVKITLQSSQIDLQEAVVIAEAGLREIVRRAIERIPQNYPAEKHRLKAYYREYSIIDSVYSHMTELFATIQDQSYVDVKDCNVFVTELRKSDDARTTKLPPHILKWSRSELAARFEFGNIIRNQRFGTFKKAENFLQGSKLHYLGQQIMDQDTLIKIGYTSNRMKATPNNAEPYFLFIGELLINKKDYGIVNSRFEINNSDSFWEMQYRKTAGKYYPSLIQRFWTIALKNQTQPYSSSSMFYIYDVEPNKKQFQKLGPHKKVIPGQSLSTMAYVYHPEFWENNSILLEIPANAALEKDLSRRQALQGQFRKNAKRVDISNKN